MRSINLPKMPPRVVHNFSQSLKHSRLPDSFWEKYYRAYFPNFKGMVEVEDDGFHQRAGIDRIVILRNAKHIYIDEKVRFKNYGDILLERLSDRDELTPGWINKDLWCDYIAYACAPSNTCYMLPFQLLRRAWRQNYERWERDYGVVLAENEGYTTESVPVPVSELFAALREAATIDLTHGEF